MKLVTIVGARPQFVKAAAVSRALARHNDAGGGRPIAEDLVHTGQHYDADMSAVFFSELGLPGPAHHLGVGSGSHGVQTGEMLKRLDPVLAAAKADAVLVYGDTNSTLAGAVAAAKLHIPVAHVEAGLRSFNRRMPEEINRVMTDHVATWLFCPSAEAVRNLAREGIERGVHVVGDVMHDVMRWHLPRASARGVLEALGLTAGRYALATVHRAENTDDEARLAEIVAGLREIAALGTAVVLPLHPRTRSALDARGIDVSGIRTIPPASYEEMLVLEASARLVLTDSGGVQKEAYWLGVPCLTLRDETEWVETVATGWNRLVPCRRDRIVAAAAEAKTPATRPAIYGEGDAADRIVAVLAGALP